MRRSVRAEAIRLSTRKSPLARYQAELVAEALRADGFVEKVELVTLETTADRRLDVAIGDLGARGAFVNEVERAVLDGRADAAVHSAKDLPSANPLGGLVLAAVPIRADPRDVLVGTPLSRLEPGAMVLTGSPRRRAQLAWLRPDLCFGELRGNIATRLSRQPENGAVVVAAAAIDRLGIVLESAEVLSTALMLPQVGQGAIALRCRADDEATMAVLRHIDDPLAHAAVAAERAFLARLGGGCEAPVGAYAEVVEGVIEIEGLIARQDGHVLLRRRHRAAEPGSAGLELAELLLEQDGAREMLVEVVRP